MSLCMQWVLMDVVALTIGEQKVYKVLEILGERGCRTGSKGYLKGVDYYKDTSSVLSDIV